jgi:predicted membrane metal-binding protein
MLTFFLVGRLISRRADSYNILAASAFLMLVYNPWFLFDAGFQGNSLSLAFFFCGLGNADTFAVNHDSNEPGSGRKFSWLWHFHAKNLLAICKGLCYHKGAVTFVMVG